MWNPQQYAKFANERDRPFFDLISQIKAANLRNIADLGCGTGHLTAHLLERWPEAEITGVDSSKEMLEQATQHSIPGQLMFVQADLREWAAPRPLDLIVSNAALQWVPDHETLVPHLAQMLAPKGALAVQMPANSDAPSHRILNELLWEFANDPNWQECFPKETWDELQALSEQRYRRSLEWYVEALSAQGFEVNAWEATYMHVLRGSAPVLEWTKGTLLRPALALLNDLLDQAEQNKFLAEYERRLEQNYPTKPWGVLFPFRRFFFVATRSV